MRNWRSAATIFMPTLISMIDGGITLTCHNNHVDEDKKKLLGAILETEYKIGRIELSRMFEHAFRLGFKAAIDILDSK